MATNIDKALYQNPVGIEESALDEEPIEIEIVDPESVDIHAGDLDIHMEPGEEDEGTIEDFDANLADFISDGALQSIAGDLDSDIDADKASRKDWEKAYTEGLKLLGLQYEERTEPWNGACGVFHPMITEAVVRFQSEAITETFPAQGPVRTKILGKQTPEKQSAAVRVENDMNSAWMYSDGQMQRAVQMQVMKQPGANTIEVADAVKALFPAFKAQLPPSVSLTTRGDRSDSIRASFRDIQTTMGVTGVLVLADGAVLQGVGCGATGSSGSTARTFYR